MRFAVFALIVATTIQPGFSEDRYVKLIPSEHGADLTSVENMLLGTWKSTDPSEKYSESWIRAYNGRLTGIRQFESDDGYKFPEYHFFAFLPQRNGSPLDMRRMVRFPGDPMTADFTAGYQHDYTNKLTISCSGKYDHQDTTIKAEYDSPSDGKLNVTLEIATQAAGEQPKSWKHIYHLTKSTD
ncbi:MAG TPA: hypothetical protein V6C97_08475 [Oculatellaceae cyanobacterium]